MVSVQIILPFQFLVVRLDVKEIKKPFVVSTYFNSLWCDQMFLGYLDDCMLRHFNSLWCDQMNEIIFNTFSLFEFQFLVVRLDGAVNAPHRRDRIISIPCGAIRCRGKDRRCNFVRYFNSLWCDQMEELVNAEDTEEDFNSLWCDQMFSRSDYYHNTDSISIPCGAIRCEKWDKYFGDIPISIPCGAIRCNPP